MSSPTATTETRAFGDATRLATARLFWAAARIPEPDVDGVRAALDAGADPELIVEAGLAQRLGPLLWRALDAADRIEALGAHADALRTDAMVRRAQAELLIPRALELAFTPLRAAGLEPLLFKGPAVAAQYPATGLRPMDDIDLLLPPDQNVRAEAALIGAGWQATPTRPGDHYDHAYLHPAAPHLPIELHRGLSSWRDQGNRLTLQRLWDARRPATTFGVPTFVVPPEEDLVALAAHAGKPYHYFTRLIWAVDLAVVVRAHPDLDWGRCLAVADEVRCRTVLAVGLRMARRLGAVVPEEAVAIRASRIRHDSLRPVLDERWPTAMPEDSVSHGLRYAMWDHAGRKAMMAAAEVTDGGWRKIPGQMRWGISGYRRRWMAARRTDQQR